MKAAIALRVARAARRSIRGHYQFLAMMLMAFLVIGPLAEQAARGLLLIKLAMTLVLLSALRAIGRSGWELWLAALLAAAGVAGQWLPHSGSAPWLYGANAGLSAAFFFYITVMIIEDIVFAERVTFDTICGAFSAYFLAAMFFAFVYALVITILPDALKLPPEPAPANPDMLARMHFLRLMYFSFTTLTTTGFGDILPNAPIARSLAILEAIYGQFYIAILVARLVSLEIIQADRDKAE